MKSIKLVILATLFIISISSAQAGIEDFSIISGSVKNSNKTDIIKIHDAPHICILGLGVCNINLGTKKLPNYNNWWSSRKNLGSYKLKWGWVNKKIHFQK
jgi:hypothetical protein